MHGHKGLVNVSYSRYSYSQTENFFEGLNSLGLPTAADVNAGTVNGAAYLPISINQATQTRCTARNAYYDPFISRPNLWISVGQTVTRINFRQRQRPAQQIQRRGSAHYIERARVQCNTQRYYQSHSGRICTPTALLVRQSFTNDTVEGTGPGDEPLQAVGVEVRPFFYA